MEFTFFKRRFRVSHPIFSIAYALVIAFIALYIILALTALYNGDTEKVEAMCLKGVLTVIIYFILATVKSFLKIKIIEEFWISKR